VRGRERLVVADQRDGGGLRARDTTGRYLGDLGQDLLQFAAREADLAEIPEQLLVHARQSAPASHQPSAPSAPPESIGQDVSGRI
jgi:hypothetical protein